MIEIIRAIHYGVLYPAGFRPPGLSPDLEAKFVARGWAKYVEGEEETADVPTTPTDTAEPENPSGEGPDDPVEAPADPEPRKTRRKKN